MAKTDVMQFIREVRQEASKGGELLVTRAPGYVLREDATFALWNKTVEAVTVTVTTRCCPPVQVVLQNDDAMQHNIVITAPNGFQEVAITAGAIFNNRATWLAPSNCLPTSIPCSAAATSSSACATTSRSATIRKSPCSIA